MSRHPLLPLLSIGALLSLGALLLLPASHPEPVLSSEPEPVWATDLDESAPGIILVGLKVTGPLEGQKRPPCSPIREREVAGACWIGTEHKPPCPEGIYESAGVCLVPVRAAKPKPTAIAP